MPTSQTPIVSPRPCPICSGQSTKLVFRQEFELFSQDGLMEGFDLVICETCGLAFSSGIPDQSAFDTYYATMSKYTSGHRDGAISPTESGRFKDTADMIVKHVQPTESIADIGCATGGLLAEFQRRGYLNLTGFDPSAPCADTARRLYGIDVRLATLNQLDSSSGQFDLLILTGVLEHVRNLNAAVGTLTAMLRPGGQVYIEVPDASAYDKWEGAPFQYFSMEHINFFSPLSLANLFRAHGCVAIATERVKRHLSPRAIEPVISMLFQHRGKTEPLIYDDITEPALMRYMENSRKVEQRIHRSIDELVATQVPLVIWGAGTHTLRLLKTSSLSKANLVSILDSNAAYQGKTLQGVPILSPTDFQNGNISILISSHTAEQEIKEAIQKTLKWTNPVICLYEE